MAKTYSQIEEMLWELRDEHNILQEKWNKTEIKLIELRESMEKQNEEVNKWRGIGGKHEFQVKQTRHFMDIEEIDLIDEMNETMGEIVQIRKSIENGEKALERINLKEKEKRKKKTRKVNKYR